MCKVEFKKCLPSEDYYDYLDFASVLQNCIYSTAESAERTIRNADCLTNFLVDASLRSIVCILVLDAEYPLGLIFSDWPRNSLALIALDHPVLCKKT